MSGLTPAPTTTRSHSKLAALGQHRGDPAVALEGAHRLAADEGHAVLFEPFLEEAPGVVAEGARERHLLDRDHRAVRPRAASEAATSAAM